MGEAWVSVGAVSCWLEGWCVETSKQGEAVCDAGRLSFIVCVGDAAGGDAEDNVLYACAFVRQNSTKFS